MPIVARTANRCISIFAEHISDLVTATVPTKLPFHSWRPEKSIAVVGFREGAPVAVPLETRFGRLYFYLSQTVEAEQTSQSRFRLRTLRYWYRLQADADPKTKALIRWEYDRDTERDRYARHHLQVPAELQAGDGKLDLNKVHLPTGWVTIEEVIRFLIVDLEVKPPCGKSWPQKLHASEEKFFQEFTGKREPGL